jgi:glutamate-1-semialdehyde 2,1-aminomutase
MAEGSARAVDLGPVLGGYHPSVAYNVRRLREISGLDEVSFHMSGTEAVMQAVRLARFHTRRTHLVRFCGAYHGWWEGVQPGIGNPVTQRETYTLKDMDEKSLHVLRRRRDIACVLVNPLQALHPNAGAPSDSALLDSARRTRFDKEAYGNWLKRLRAVCTEQNIVLVFDEVFVGFRLARGGAQEYFDVRADLVTYGKTLGGGLPIGVVCGRHHLMKRFRSDRPADICFARGTFNSHPYVMTAMDEFLSRLASPNFRSVYNGLDETWNDRARTLNDRLAAADLPVRVSNLSSIWMVHYTEPSRYNWMLQYYLRAEGLALSWVGMWMGLRSSRHHRATLATLGCVMGLPWLAIFLLVFLGAGRGFSPGFLIPVWFALGIMTDLVVGTSARARLRRDFRNLIVGPNETPNAPPVWPPADSRGSATSFATPART